MRNGVMLQLKFCVAFIYDFLINFLSFVIVNIFEILCVIDLFEYVGLRWISLNLYFSYQRKFLVIKINVKLHLTLRLSFSTHLILLTRYFFSMRIICCASNKPKISRFNETTKNVRGYERTKKRQRTFYVNFMLNFSMS